MEKFVTVVLGFDESWFTAALLAFDQRNETTFARTYEAETVAPKPEGALPFDDPRWAQFRAGYRTPVDLRPLLRNLEEATDPGPAWSELWQELFHQGDIGEGSFAAVPHLLRIHRDKATADWNTYALVATIELARNNEQNPDVPQWLRDAYFGALSELAGIGLAQLSKNSDAQTVRAILGLLAIVHDAPTYGRVLIDFSEEEVRELEEAAFGEPDDE